MTTLSSGTSQASWRAILICLCRSDQNSRVLSRWEVSRCISMALTLAWSKKYCDRSDYLHLHFFLQFFNGNWKSLRKVNRFATAINHPIGLHAFVDKPAQNHNHACNAIITAFANTTITMISTHHNMQNRPRHDAARERCDGVADIFDGVSSEEHHNEVLHARGIPLLRTENYGVIVAAFLLYYVQVLDDHFLQEYNIRLQTGCRNSS